MPRGRNDYETAQIQGRLWTPAVLRPDAWFDAADLSTISVATGVSEWRDKSGNGKHVSQSTGSLQPSLQQGFLNGLPVLQFDGSDDWLGCNTWSGTITSQSSFAMFRLIAHSGYYGRVYTQTSSSAADQAYVPCLEWVGSAQYGSYISGTNPGDALSKIALSTGVWYLWSSIHDGAAIRNRTSKLDGGSAASTISIALSDLRIGDEINTNQTPSLNGYFCELLMFNNRTITTRERWLIEGYKAWKWGVVSELPADHPFANRPPLIGD